MRSAAASTSSVGGSEKDAGSFGFGLDRISTASDIMMPLSIVGMLPIWPCVHRYIMHGCVVTNYYTCL